MTTKAELKHLAEQVYNMRSDLEKIIDDVEKLQEKLLDIHIAISSEAETLER